MKIRFSLYLILLLVLFACKKIDSNVSVTYTNADDEIPTQLEFIFTFDHPLVEEAAVGKWDSTNYVTFNPEIPGRFSWRSQRDLIFTPLQELPPSTEYEAKLNNSLLQNVEGIALGGQTTFNFYTPTLILTDAHAYWSQSPSATDIYEFNIDLSFNYLVDPSEVNDHLTVKIDQKEVDYQLISQSVEKKVSLKIEQKSLSKEDLAVAISLSPGLTPAGGNNGTSEKTLKEMKVTSPFRLEIGEASVEHDGFQGTITFPSSQELKKENIKQFINISPSLDYEVQIGTNNISITSSDFEVGASYEVSLKENLRGLLGGVLSNTIDEKIAFGELEPRINFPDRKAVYLSSQGSQLIELDIINVKEIEVKLMKIYPNNIKSFLSQGYYYYDDYYENGESYQYSEPNYDYYRSSELGDVVWSKKVFTESLPIKNRKRLLDLNVDKQLNQYEGLYVLQVRNGERSYPQAYKVICLSDIGLITKMGDQSITIFANSIKTASPLPNVEISLIGQNNQELTTLRTDSKGVASHSWNELPASGFNLAMVTASLENDFTYLPFDRTRVYTSRFDVGGKIKNEAGLNTFLYGERDIYRPGETLHLAAIIRDEDWKAPSTQPVILRVKTPDGKDFVNLKKTLSDRGDLEADIELATDVPTGRYSVFLENASGTQLANTSILVEEFIPDRIKVEISANKEEAKPSDDITLSGQAQSFFGPPAANRDYQLSFTTRPAYFSAEEHLSYRFSLNNLPDRVREVERAGKTDEEGKVNETFTVPKEFANTGKMQAEFFVSVFDETGRPVNRRLTIPIYTQDVFYGIQPADYYYGLSQSVRLPIIAVNKDGKLLTNTPATIKLIKHEYKTVLNRSGRYYRYSSEKVEKVIEEKEVTLDSKNYTYSYQPEESGRYELRVYAPGSNYYVNSSFYFYGYRRTSRNSFKVNNEGQIDIELDKEKYDVGDKANVLFKTPFSGKLLVTVESDHVHEYFYLDTDERSASLTIDLKEDMVPNVYISAVLFRPNAPSDIPLTVAHGYAPMMVQNPSAMLPVDIVMAQKSRSKTSQEIQIKTWPNAAVAIAVVDEGILQLTNYETPDPYGYFYGKQALAVTGYDVYPYLFPEIERPLSIPGGGDVALGSRINPLVNDRVKLATFWSGILTANNQGRVNFSIDIPEFSGSLRVMAIAYNKDAFGSLSKNMTIADPVVVSSGIPRFLSPGDTLEMPVTFANTTDQSVRGSASLSLEGPLKALGESTASVQMGSSSESSVEFQIATECCIGQAQIKTSLNALGETFSQTTDITVRPASPLQKRTGGGVITGNTSETFYPDTRDFMPEHIVQKVTISPSPLVEFSKDFTYLLRSNFGCVEQTVSAAFPQLYFPAFTQLTMQQTDYPSNPRNNVNKAINRLKRMQLYNGGFTYWPGEGKESWWGSVYATHFLFEAKKAGYDVPDRMLALAYQRLIERLKDVDLYEYRYYRNNSISTRKIIPKSVAYSLFVLSLAGKPQLATMNYYQGRKNDLTQDSEYLLSAAYALAGDSRTFKALAPTAFNMPRSVKEFGGSFSSPIRDEAISLYVLLEVDPNNDQVGFMAKHISENLNSKRYLNTQERVFSLLALGKLGKRAQENALTAEISINKKPWKTFDKTPLTYKTVQAEPLNVTVSTKGVGQLYYFWETEGVSIDGSYIEEDNYIEIRKSFYDRSGNRISSNQFKQNDLVVVKMELENQSNRYIENVIATDLLPAGFEIENPRISAVPGLDWIKNATTPRTLDIRDDRIFMVVDLPKYNSNNQQHIINMYYIVRAVSKGTFVMGPVSAEAMYDAEYHSYHGAGIIKVTD